MKEHDIEAWQSKYKMTFQSEHGAEVLTHLERLCNGKTTSFNTDPYRMAYNEGRRSVVLHIQTLLTMDVKRLREMAKQQGGE